MTAQDYPVSFPYGSTSPPYTPTHPHRGDDRACPLGTPIVIGGTTIGFTGYSGYIVPPGPAGAHLHIQEWQGNIVTGIRKPQNAFKGGTVVNIDPTQTQGDGSFGKFITVKTDDGWNDSYCHLSVINVQIGQVLKGGIMPDDYKMNSGDVTNYFQWFIKHDPTQADLDAWVGQTHKKFMYEKLKLYDLVPAGQADAQIAQIKEILK